MRSLVIPCAAAEELAEGRRGSVQTMSINCNTELYHLNQKRRTLFGFGPSPVDGLGNLCQATLYGLSE